MKTLLPFALLITTSAVFAQVQVHGYTKRDGTYVAPHERTAPNHTVLDNYSTKGNVNPYTGKPGTKNPDPYGTTPTMQPQPLRPDPPTQATQQIQPQSNPYVLTQPSTNRF